LAPHIEQAAYKVVRSQINNRKTLNSDIWIIPKRVRNRPTHSATVAFSWQEEQTNVTRLI